MVLIPATIIGNSLFIIHSFQTSIDFQLQRQALLIAETFDATSFQSVTDVASAQASIQRMIASETEELRSFDILIPEGSKFKVVASSYPGNIGKLQDSSSAIPREYFIAWDADQGTARLAAASDQDVAQNPALKNQRYYNIVFPLHDADGNKIALLNLKMSIKVTDDLTRQTLLGSSGILVLTLLIVIGLLMINTRLFEYAVLINKLKEVDQMKDEFISMASHELRSPITALKGYISMFSDGSFGALSEAGKKSIAIIESSIRRLADLVEDLLDVSRIEQNRLQVSLEEVNIDEVISMTIDEMAVNAQSKKITIAYPTKGKSMPTVHADKDKLRQIMVNLLSNAIKYTPAGSVLITVQPQPDETHLIVKVKDSGIGMSAPEHEKLFTKFYRVKSESTKGIIGTGLGLWITKQLVELMGGKIYVDSIVGTGTEFSFTIPVFVAPVTKKS